MPLIPLFPDHDQVGADIFGDADYGIGHLSCAWIVHFDGNALLFGLSEQPCTGALSVLAHPVDLKLASARIGEARLDGEMNHLNGMQLRP